MIQISLDGPSGYWDVLKIHSKQREENELYELFNTGSCGLYVMHDDSRTGLMETDWEIHKILHAMWKIFDDSSAKKQLYVRNWL